MKKTKARIKEHIQIHDEIHAIEYIANFYFTETEEGMKYTPYYTRIAQVEAIVKYFIEGIEFEKDEDIYECACNDDDIRQLLKEFYASELFECIMKDVSDIVEYRKSENIAKAQSLISEVVAYKLLELTEKENKKLQLETETTIKLGKWLDDQKELNEMIPPEIQKKFAENLDINAVMESAINHFENSKLHKLNKEIIELNKDRREKDNKISQMEIELAKDKQKDAVKNVLDYKKKK